MSNAKFSNPDVENDDSGDELLRSIIERSTINKKDKKLFKLSIAVIALLASSMIALGYMMIDQAYQINEARNQINFIEAQSFEVKQQSDEISELAELVRQNAREMSQLRALFDERIQISGDAELDNALDFDAQAALEFSKLPFNGYPLSADARRTLLSASRELVTGLERDTINLALSLNRYLIQGCEQIDICETNYTEVISSARDFNRKYPDEFEGYIASAIVNFDRGWDGGNVEFFEKALEPFAAALDFVKPEFEAITRINFADSLRMSAVLDPSRYNKAIEILNAPGDWISNVSDVNLFDKNVLEYKIDHITGTANLGLAKNETNLQRAIFFLRKAENTAIANNLPPARVAASSENIAIADLYSANYANAERRINEIFGPRSSAWSLGLLYILIKECKVGSFQCSNFTLEKNDLEILELYRSRANAFTENFFSLLPRSFQDAYPELRP